jgi:DMSO reductase family type II enzyme heme b subunit
MRRESTRWWPVALLLAVCATPALAEQAPPAEESKGPVGVVSSKLVEGELPSDDPFSPRWAEAAVATFPTSPQVHWDPRIFNVTVKEIKLRSLHHGQRIVFLLEYADKTENPGDAAAIEFPVGGKAHFAHAQEMAQIESGSVNIWYWKASAGGVTDMNAKGFKTTAPQSQQNVTGKGVWKDGVWRVLFTRDLTDADAEDIQFAPGAFVQIAFAVWDEANFEKGSMKAVTSWWWFVAEPPADRTVYIYTGLVVLIVVGIEAFVVRRVRRTA